MIDRATGKITPVPVDLTYTQAKPQQKLLIHAARFWKGSGADVQKDVDILITDNRITSVTPHSASSTGWSHPHGRGSRLDRATWLSKITSTPTPTTASTTAMAWDGCGSRMASPSCAASPITPIAHQDTESYIAGAATGPRVFNTGEAVDGERVYYPMMIATTSEASSIANSTVSKR